MPFVVVITGAYTLIPHKMQRILAGRRAFCCQNKKDEKSLKQSQSF